MIAIADVLRLSVCYTRTEKERRLRHELRRVKALYADAQTVIKKHQEGAGSRASVKQLRNQVRSCHVTRSAPAAAPASSSSGTRYVPVAQHRSVQLQHLLVHYG